jgi:alcohol dehydrogenase class IV
VSHSAPPGPGDVGSFDLALPARISFGAGRAAELPGIVAGLGRRVLVVTGASPERVEPLVDPLRPGAERLAMVGVAGEPTVADARRAAEAGVAVGADVLVAIGGGSPIDLAKAAAMLLANGGDPMDYIEVVGLGRPIVRPALPVVAVPTTAGTGAEVTTNAVLAVPEHGLKASLRHPGMIPRHAVVDPVLTLGCPPGVTAAAGMDALTQCLEPYVSRQANPATDGWARSGLRAAGRSILRAHADGTDLASRTDMALCSLMGGLALANAKLGAVHGFAGVLGGMTQAPHGAICAALLAPVCRANLARADARSTARFGDVARWLTGSPAATAEDGLVWIERIVTALGIPGLAALGLTEDRLADVADLAARASSMRGNPVDLTHEELVAVLRAAL